MTEHMWVNIFPGFLTVADKLHRSVTLFVESPVTLLISNVPDESSISQQDLFASEELWKHTQSTENRWQVGSFHSLIFHDICIRICVESACPVSP